MPPKLPIVFTFNRAMQIALLSFAPILVGACNNQPDEDPVAVVDQPTVVQESPTQEEPVEPTEPAAPESSGPITFVVVTEESSASYVADEEFFEDAVERFNVPLGQTITVGTTPDVSGQLTVVKTDPPTIVSGEIRVGLGSLTSDQNRRDQQLQERLNIISFPDAVFIPTSIEGFPPGYTEGQTANFQLVGDMTIAGLSQPVTFESTATLVDGRIEAEAQTTFLLSSFGIEPPSFLGVFDVQDPLTVNVTLVLVEDPAASNGAAQPRLGHGGQRAARS